MAAGGSIPCGSGLDADSKTELQHRLYNRVQQHADCRRLNSRIKKGWTKSRLCAFYLVNTFNTVAAEDQSDPLVLDFFLS
jgi:hypothetical protein